jgi:homoserine kinase
MAKPPKITLPSSLELVLPATSANLGPAFDAAALALSLYLTIKARPAADFSIVAKGRDAQFCAPLENNLILETYRDILRAERKPVVPLALQLKNDIPIGKGCGSSAAARLAGIALAIHFGDLRWADTRIIGEAARREHHPDNAAACWVGGLVVARMTRENESQIVRFEPKGNWPLLLAIPPESLSTEEARRVLPAQYSRSDVIANVQNSMFLLAAFSQARRDLLPTALADRIHQPYRAHLCPLLPAIQQLVGSYGVAGVALSGAGPSVLIFLDPHSTIKKVSAAIAAHLKSHDLAAELLLTEISTRGAREGKDWKKKNLNHRPDIKNRQPKITELRA